MGAVIGSKIYYGQNNGLDLCRSDNFIIVSEMEGMREHTIDGTLQESVNDEESVISQDIEKQ